ncbi:MAG TPA: sugar phosphate nucleotidyltransferase, partial [Isosphaeraceae bacterium]
NILERPIAAAVAEFHQNPVGAKILVTEVEHPEWYGVVELDGPRVARIVEKPKQPTSRLVAIGVYMYDNRVFEHIRQIEPSARGELEITDVNNLYIDRDLMRFHRVEGWWADAGESFPMYLKANLLAASLHGVHPTP